MQAQRTALTFTLTLTLTLALGRSRERPGSVDSSTWGGRGLCSSVSMRRIFPLWLRVQTESAGGDDQLHEYTVSQLTGRRLVFTGGSDATVGDLKRHLASAAGLASHALLCVVWMASPGANGACLNDDGKLLVEFPGGKLFVLGALSGSMNGPDPGSSADAAGDTLKWGWGQSRLGDGRMSTGTPTKGPPDGDARRPAESKLVSGSHTVHNRPLTREEEDIATLHLQVPFHDGKMCRGANKDPTRECKHPFCAEVINDVLHFAPVSRLKIRCLQRTEWLNDEVINIYMGLLKARGDAATEADALPRCHFFTTMFYAKLYSDMSVYQFTEVKRWTKKVDIFATKDLIICPIHCHGNHWTLGIVNFRDKRFEYFDSVSAKCKDTGEYLCSDDGGVLKNLRRYIHDEHLMRKKTSWDDSGWTDVVWVAGVHMPRQTNDHDCGVFMCKTADLYAQNACLEFSQVH